MVTACSQYISLVVALSLLGAAKARRQAVFSGVQTRTLWLCSDPPANVGSYGPIIVGCSTLARSADATHDQLWAVVQTALQPVTGAATSEMSTGYDSW